MKKNYKNLFSTLAVSFFIFIAFGSGDDDNEKLKLNADGTPMTEQQIKVDNQFSSWDGSHPALTELIKKNMNEPDSYDHIETKFKDNGDNILVVTKFRGANAFGGKVINTVTANVDYNGNVIEIISQN